MENVDWANLRLTYTHGAEVFEHCLFFLKSYMHRSFGFVIWEGRSGQMRRGWLNGWFGWLVGLQVLECFPSFPPSFLLPPPGL